MNEAERPVVWVGSSRKDLREFPREVRRDIGHALTPRRMVRSILRQSPCAGLAEAPWLRSSRIIAATPGEPCTAFVLRKRFTFYTRSKRNRSEASPPRRGT